MLIHEALIAGVGFFDVYDHTFGELIQIVDAKNERNRRNNQDLSIIAMKQAYLTALYATGKGFDLKIYDIFPYWTKEEKREMLVAEWKNKMYNIAAKGR